MNRYELRDTQLAAFAAIGSGVDCCQMCYEPPTLRADAIVFNYLTARLSLMKRGRIHVN
jgi:hypothetical protein